MVQHQYTRYRHGRVSRSAKQYKAAQRRTGKLRQGRAGHGREGYGKVRGSRARHGMAEQGRVPGQGWAYQYVRSLYRPCAALLCSALPWSASGCFALRCHGCHAHVLSYRSCPSYPDCHPLVTYILLECLKYRF
jgi:hypothetical protein